MNEEKIDYSSRTSPWILYADKNSKRYEYFPINSSKK
jgi:hypothetical protein